MDSQGRLRVNFPQRNRLYPSVPMAVTPVMSIDFETLAINVLTPITCQRDHRAAMGVTLLCVRTLASRSCAECLLTAQSQGLGQAALNPEATRTLLSSLNSSRVCRAEPRLAGDTDLTIET